MYVGIYSYGGSIVPRCCFVKKILLCTKLLKNCVSMKKRRKDTKHIVQKVSQYLV